LGISVGTVRKHVEAILITLALDSRAAVAALVSRRRYAE